LPIHDTLLGTPYNVVVRDTHLSTTEPRFDMNHIICYPAATRCSHGEQTGLPFGRAERRPAPMFQAAARPTQTISGIHSTSTANSSGDRWTGGCEQPGRKGAVGGRPVSSRTKNDLPIRAEHHSQLILRRHAGIPDRSYRFRTLEPAMANCFLSSRRNNNGPGQGRRGAGDRSCVSNSSGEKATGRATPSLFCEHPAYQPCNLQKLEALIRFIRSTLVRRLRAGSDGIVIPHADTVRVIAGLRGRNIIEDGDPLVVRLSPHGGPPHRVTTLGCPGTPT
jgi:hypothetical protein